MRRIRLIHWKAAEFEERAEWLRSAGYEVESEALSPAQLRAMRDDPPSAVVIDLSRAPSQGRDLALGLRKRKSTRYVPLVFVGGDPAKAARIKDLLPDAVYTTWDEIRTPLEQAIAHPPADPVVPDSVFAAYAGTPMPQKLGIKANSVVALVGAPEGFEETLGELPEGAVVHRSTDQPPDMSPDLAMWFATSREEVERRIEEMGALADKGSLWIAWPKKASGVKSNLSQNVVREIGLASGLVDYKVCAIDAIWSGLCFTQRKSDCKAD